MKRIHKVPGYSQDSLPYVKVFMKRLSSFEHDDERYYHDHSCRITEISGVCTCGLLDTIHNLNIHELVYANELLKHGMNCGRQGIHVSSTTELKYPKCKVKI